MGLVRDTFAGVTRFAAGVKGVLLLLVPSERGVGVVPRPEVVHLAAELPPDLRG